MRILFLLLMLFVLPSAWPESVCKNLNGDLEKSASTYHDCMKSLSDTLMTTPNVTTKINPDINKVQKVKKEISNLVRGCKNDDGDEDDISQKIKDVLSKIKELDLDLQKMGTFDNGVVNTARISAIEKSNNLIAVLQNSIGDDAEKKEDDEDGEENYEDAKDDDEDSDDSDTEEEDPDSDEDDEADDEET